MEVVKVEATDLREKTSVVLCCIIVFTLVTHGGLAIHNFNFCSNTHTETETPTLTDNEESE